MTNVVIRLAGAAWLPHLARWIIHVVTKAALVSVHVSGQGWGLCHPSGTATHIHTQTPHSVTESIFITSNCVASGAAFRASIIVSSSWHRSVTALSNSGPLFSEFDCGSGTPAWWLNPCLGHSTRRLLSRLKHWGNKRGANYNAPYLKCFSAHWAEPPNHLSKRKAA